MIDLSFNPGSAINVKARYKQSQHYKAGNDSEIYEYNLKQPSNSILTSEFSQLNTDTAPETYFNSLVDKYSIVYNDSGYEYYLGKLTMGNQVQDNAAMYYTYYVPSPLIINYEYAFLSNDQASIYKTNQYNYEVPTNLDYNDCEQNPISVPENNFYKIGNEPEYAYMAIRVKETTTSYESMPSIITIKKPAA